VGVENKSDEPRPELNSLNEKKVPEEVSSKTVLLTKISNLQNINALARGQEIPSAHS